MFWRSPHRTTNLENRAGRSLASTPGLILLWTVALAATGAAAAPSSPRPEAPGAVQAAPADAWPIFRGTPALTGLSRARISGSLTLKWSRDLGGNIPGSPVAAGGRVFVATSKGKLAALALDSGKILWTRDSGNSLHASPSVWEGRVFIGDDEGELHAFRAADGAELWKFATENKITGSANRAAPGRIVIGSYDYFVYCLDAAAGALIWKFETDAQVHATPAVCGDLIVVSGCDGNLRLLAADGGKQRQAIQLEANFAASPAWDGRRWYLGSFSGVLLAVTADAEKPVVWQVTTAARETFVASAATDGKVVLFAGRDRTVHCLDCGTGEVRWRFRGRRRIDSSPVIVGDRILVGSGEGVLYVLSRQEGRVLQRFEAGASIPGSPAVASGLVLLAARDGMVYCLDAADRP